ncbi:hypothetical protein [Halobacillus karajensis]|nr:hypothetical protein [Halobacillus karajensis]
MNHLFSSIPCPLEDTYRQLKEEIIDQADHNQELKNLEAAISLIHKEISGRIRAGSEF